MREIKFRGREYDGHWAIGDVKISEHIERATITLRKDGYLIPCPVDIKTVGQFTGLLDSEGKEIYEDDIVRFKEAYKGVLNEELVREVVGVVSYVYCEFKVVSDGTYELLAPSLMEGVTVIGNIHDNPELLEAQHA